MGTKVLTAAVVGLKAGDLVAAVPITDLPSGVAIAFVRVPTDNTIEIALEALLSITLAAPITFSLAALR